MLLKFVLCIYERLDVTIKHPFDIAHLNIGTMVFHHLVRMEYV